MNLYQYRSHVKIVAENLRLSKDSRLTDRWIDFLIASYRSVGIRETYKRNGEIDPIWLQDFGKVAVSCINSADDPAIPYTSRKLGKVSLPVVVSLPEDKGVHRIASSSKLKRYYYSTDDEFFSKIPGSITTDFFEYYCRVGSATYLSDAPGEINFVGIIENPMDGVVLLTEKVGQSNLTVGQNYTVYDTQIIHDSVAYNPSQTFTAVNTTYSGNGYVKFTIQKRAITDRDPYPMSLTMLEFVVMKIFTVEFAIDKTQVADIVNDAAVQEQLNQNANSNAVLKAQE